MNHLRRLQTKCLFLFAYVILLLSMGCNKEEPFPEEPEVPGFVQENQIKIEKIQGIPAGVVFDRISAEINGKWWEIILTVTAEYNGNSILLKLPENIESTLLHPSQQSKEEYGLGYWPATSSDPLAGVAALGDIIAYNGDKAVGRIYLSDWSGEGSTASKAFIYYQYAEREFSLSGRNSSFSYSATFKAGWNTYAYINHSVEESGTSCTTEIPEGLQLQWRFESWVYSSGQ